MCVFLLGLPSAKPSLLHLHFLRSLSLSVEGLMSLTSLHPPWLSHEQREEEYKIGACPPSFICPSPWECEKKPLKYWPWQLQYKDPQCICSCRGTKWGNKTCAVHLRNSWCKGLFTPTWFKPTCGKSWNNFDFVSPFPSFARKCAQHFHQTPSGHWQFCNELWKWLQICGDSIVVPHMTAVYICWWMHCCPLLAWF